MTPMTRLIPLLLAAAAAGCSPQPTAPAAEPAGQAATPPIIEAPELTTRYPQPEVGLPASVARFGIDLYRQVAVKAPTDGNVTLSPLSVSAAMSMVLLGAAGTTEAEMRATLRQDDAAAGWYTPAWAGLMQQLNPGADSPVTLALANRLWGATNEPFRAPFLATLEKVFGAGLAQSDFAGNPEGVRVEINGWVDGVTRGMIPDLLDPGTLDARTRLVVVNALYMKAPWLRAFDPARTIDAPFYDGGGATGRDVPMMLSDGEWRYAEDDRVQVLELPYAGDELSMIVVLPRQRDGLPALEQSMTAEDWNRWRAALAPRSEVRVALPRFKVEGSFNLAETLQAMGMKTLFGPTADLSKMSELGGLAVSDVIHRAVVDVAEEGTEAAAATAVIIKRMSVAADPPPVFRADHPFLFAIVRRADGLPLFLGRIAAPGK